MSTGTVSLSLDEYNALRAEITKRDAQLEEVVRERDLARSGILANLPVETTTLIAAIYNATSIVRFAVSNLDPEIVRGWPTLALRTHAQVLEAIPDEAATEMASRALALELRNFASEAERLAALRADGRHKDLEAQPRG